MTSDNNFNQSELEGRKEYNNSQRKAREKFERNVKKAAAEDAGRNRVELSIFALVSLAPY